MVKVVHSCPRTCSSGSFLYVFSIPPPRNHGRLHFRVTDLPSIRDSRKTHSSDFADKLRRQLKNIELVRKLRKSFPQAQWIGAGDKPLRNSIL
jgi:hypothetical protein